MPTKWYQSLTPEQKREHNKRWNTSAKKKRWEENNPAKLAAANRKYNLAKKYAWTEEEFQSMLCEQEYGCAICGTKTPGGKCNQWHIDHNHKTGRVRGILCNRCNVGLGKFNDSIAELYNAIEYLLHFS